MDKKDTGIDYSHLRENPAQCGGLGEGTGEETFGIHDLAKFKKPNETKSKENPQEN